MGNEEAETLALLKLSMCEGLGTGGVHRLLSAFGSAEAALGARPEGLEGVGGLTAAAVRSLRRGVDQRAVDDELAMLETVGARLVPFLSEDYPPPLKQLESDAPPLLCIKGDYQRRDLLAVALIGSRRCSHYGRTQARRFAIDMAGMGLAVVSGLARGIDSEAHRGAIQAKGRTIAVVGCGLGQLCEREGWDLACEIAEHGAVITELRTGVPALAGNFPPRNRLISGLSLGVVVMEAAQRSGGLITARWAGEQGKGVFAVPGNVDSPTSRGCHALIKDGAILVESARDVVEGLGPLSEPLQLVEWPGAAAKPSTVHDARVLALNQRERQVFELVGRTPVHIDAVIERSGLPASIVSSTLLTLEIRGLLQQLSGQRYVHA